MEMDLKTLIILFKAYHSVENSVKHSLIKTGVNVNEFMAMEALYNKKELSTQQLIDTILIPNSSMTYVLEILDKKKYIKRTKKPQDKRVQIISLTKLGKDFFEDVYIKHYNYMSSIFNVLNSKEEELLQELLKKIGYKAVEVLK